MPFSTEQFQAFYRRTRAEYELGDRDNHTQEHGQVGVVVWHGELVDGVHCSAFSLGAGVPLQGDCS